MLRSKPADWLSHAVIAMTIGLFEADNELETAIVSTHTHTHTQARHTDSKIQFVSEQKKAVNLFHDVQVVREILLNENRIKSSRSKTQYCTVLAVVYEKTHAL